MIFLFKFCVKAALVCKNSCLSGWLIALHLQYLCPCLIKPASTLYQPNPKMPRDKSELIVMVKKAALVVKDRPALEVLDASVDCYFQFHMIVIDFDKNLENLLIV